MLSLYPSHFLVRKTLLRKKVPPNQEKDSNNPNRREKKLSSKKKIVKVSDPSKFYLLEEDVQGEDNHQFFQEKSGNADQFTNAEKLLPYFIQDGYVKDEEGR